MNWLKKIFGIKQDEFKNETTERQVNTNLSEIDELIDVKKFIESHNRNSYVLNPHKTTFDLKIDENKFGGTPNLKNFDVYPKCKTCKTNMNFVLQVYKDQNNSSFFPEQTDLFQVFRCPNTNCDDSYNQFYDLPTKLYYFKDNSNGIQIEKLTIPVSENHETEIPTCEIRGTIKDDLPQYDDHDSDIDSKIEEIYGEDGSEYFTEKYQPIIGTKMGGHPSWIQGAYKIDCKCGTKKEFIFQLSSEDREEGVPYPPPHDKWSPHKIMIGDVGNLYFFMCKNCGIESIESNWDCF